MTPAWGSGRNGCGARSARPPSGIECRDAIGVGPPRYGAGVEVPARGPRSGGRRNCREVREAAATVSRAFNNKPALIVRAVDPGEPYSAAGGTRSDQRVGGGGDAEWDAGGGRVIRPIHRIGSP